MMNESYINKLADDKKNSCTICGRLADSREDKELCSKCWRFLCTTSPLMIESKLYHFAAMQRLEFQKMAAYLKAHYNEYEDDSYLRSDGSSIFEHILIK